MDVPGRSLLDRLLSEGQIDREQHERAILHAQRIEEHAEDALLSLGTLGEADLLKYKASVYRTRFVSTQKLSKAQIQPSVVRLIPRRIAERLQIFPILFDSAQQQLSVVAADFESHDIVKQVQVVTSLRNVAAYVARPAAVKALQQKYYDGDAQAFGRLVQAKEPGSFVSNYYEDRDEPTTGTAFQIDTAADVHADRVRGTGTFTPPPQMFGPGSMGASRDDAAYRISAPDIRIAPPPVAPVEVTTRTIEQPPPPPTPTVTFKGYLDTLNVLVALLEQDREELRGHSGQVARLVSRLCDRIDLPDVHRRPIMVAAFLHDLGKSGPYHLTPFNVAQYEGHRVQAKKVYLTGLRMLESAGLPEATVRGLTHLYERYDGNGFPDRLSAKEIPLCSRVLGVVETYCDLTSHSKNPFRKVLTAKEACDVLVRYKGTYFDGMLVDVFQSEVLGDDLRSKLLADRPTLLVADPDAEETTVLELRLVENGYDVVITRNAEAALERVGSDIDALIAEVELTPFDGFELVQRARAVRPDLPFLFLTTRGDGESVNRGFELGAADYLVKPASAEVVAAKIRKMFASTSARPNAGSRGVSGSLKEMSLPDVVQILSNGRKSGKLSIRAAGKSGDIFFQDGAIWDAMFGDAKGAEGFYAMLLLEDGDFTLDPEGRCEERVIKESPEGLLLEGMRRLDEDRR